MFQALEFIQHGLQWPVADEFNVFPANDLYEQKLLSEHCTAHRQNWSDLQCTSEQRHRMSKLTWRSFDRSLAYLGVTFVTCDGNAQLEGD